LNYFSISLSEATEFGPKSGTTPSLRTIVRLVERGSAAVTPVIEDFRLLDLSLRTQLKIE
jgi:hypothetical protein